MYNRRKNRKFVVINRTQWFYVKFANFKKSSIFLFFFCCFCSFDSRNFLWYQYCKNSWFDHVSNWLSNSTKRFEMFSKNYRIVCHIIFCQWMHYFIALFLWNRFVNHMIVYFKLSFNHNSCKPNHISNQKFQIYSTHHEKFEFMNKMMKNTNYEFNVIKK